MDVVVTLVADDQGPATAHPHRLDPRRFLRLSPALEVGQPSNMMHFDLLLSAAELAGVSQHPIEQLRPVAPHVRGPRTRPACFGDLEVECATAVPPSSASRGP
jgi:hypothetical protein